MFSFVRALTCVGFYCVFHVDFSTSCQGDLIGRDDYITLKCDDVNPDFAATVYCFGANIVSWLVNGTEHLFLSKKTPIDDRQPIIGGIPIVFPIYGNWTFGKDHEFLKTVRWEIFDCPIKDWDAGVWSMSFMATDTVYTRQMWNYHFEMYYYLTINCNILTMRILLYNTDEKTPFHFKLGFRNHIRVPEVTHSTIQNLIGVPFYDNTDVPQNLTEEPKKQDDQDDLRITKWIDRLYPYAPNEVIITNVAGGRNLRITTRNLPDLVVWNPWKDHNRGDEKFAEDDYREFIGIHTGVFGDYMKMPPHGSYEAMQSFELF